MFYLTTHSTHFIYGYMASDIWLRTIVIVRKETRCRHIGYSFRLTARVLLYVPSHRQDNTYHGLSYTSRGALAGTRHSSLGPPREGFVKAAGELGLLYFLELLTVVLLSNAVIQVGISRDLQSAEHGKTTASRPVYLRGASSF